LQTYLADKQKWAHLDKDGDQALSYDEFRKFLRPEDDENLRKLEITSIITEYDEDNDGKISALEYLKMTGTSNHNQTIVISFSLVEAETGMPDPLGPELDTNNDGFGVYEEFARYYLPTSSSTTVEETDHLLKECDINEDGFCSPDEIVNAYSSFAGSQITDFGADLESAKEEL
jgi:Ca2+-binding EF-hand superfamily protein